VQVRIARIFNTYGPRMCIDDGRVVSNFVAQVSHSSGLPVPARHSTAAAGRSALIITVLQALRKDPLTVYGDGKQTRSFQYVSDLVMPMQSLTPHDRGPQTNRSVITQDTAPSLSLVVS
jgi:UDP-glucuronate decarboxylase